MLKDFTVAEDAVGLQASGACFDLHNDYNLHEIRIHFPAKALDVEFRPANG
jgi:hypothetical protein